jgi:predicted MFS family arabinose efflux permease
MGGLTRRLGPLQVFIAGVAVTILAVLLVGTTRDYTLLALYRIAAGLAGAAIFVAGGTLSAALVREAPERSGLLLSIFYAGPGLGIALSAIAIWATFALSGPQSWQAAWIVLGLLCLFAGLGTLLLRNGTVTSTTAHAEPGQGYRPLRHWQILLGYCLFGSGAIGYMTFMVSRLQQGGVSPAGTALFWLLIGVGSIAAPLIWSNVIRRLQGGRAFAVLTAVNTVAAVLPLLSQASWATALSALVFGSCFFSIVASTTAFAARNVSAPHLPKAIAAFTVAFGVGQAVGPMLTGAIADIGGGLGESLAVSVFLVALGALVGFLQRDTMEAG